jgi:transglutaminase-like putative cysteine protease
MARSTGLLRFAEGEKVSARLGVLGAGVCALLCLVTGLTFSSVFPLSSVIAPVVVSSVVALGVGVVTRRLRGVVLVVVHFAALVVVAHLTVLRSLTVGGVGIPTGSSVRTFGEAFRNGWSRILTTPVPMDAEPDVSLVIVLVVFGAAVMATLVMLRTRWKLAALLGPLVVLVTTRVLGATSRVWWNAAATALCLVGAALAAMLRTRTSTSSGKMAAGGSSAVTDKKENPLADDRARGILFGGVLAVVAGLVGSQLPLFRSTPADARHIPLATPALQEAQNPLSLLSSWAQNPDKVLFRFNPDADTAKQPPLSRWRLAVLDTFTGADWLPGERYRDVGSALPRPPVSVGIATDEKPRSASVDLVGLDDVWLPSPGWPRRIEGLAPRFDPERGVLRQRATDADKRVTRYQVIAQPMVAKMPSDVGGLDISEDSRLRTETPQSPAEFVAAANEIVADAQSPSLKAQRLDSYLRALAGFRFNPATQPGHSYKRLSLLLRGTPPLGGQGTSEQYATVFALLARNLGMPSRVVVGFDIPAGTVAGADGFVSVTAGMALAWPEVRFAGVGWVPFQPTPGTGGATPEDQSAFNGASEPTTTTTSTVVPTTEVAEEEQIDRVPAKAVSAWWLVLVGVLATVGALGVALRVVIARRRRDRRTNGDGRAQISGAWDEALAVLSATAMHLQPAETASHFAGRLEEKHGGVKTLASLHESAAFRLSEPAPDDVAKAWTLSDELRAQVVATLPTSARMRLYVEPLVPSALKKSAEPKAGRRRKPKQPI